MTANTVYSVLGLFGFWIAIYYLWRDFRNDAFRDDLFSIRDEMFLYAAQGNIQFDDPAYVFLRNRMNVLLRHGHELTLSRFALLITTQLVTKTNEFIAWEFAVEQLPEESKTKMKDFSARVAIFVLQHVVFFSFFRYIALRPLAFLVELPKLIRSPKVADGVERLEAATIEREARHLRQQAATA